jgi:uncharacterized protein YggT (Ycf19 family)
MDRPPEASTRILRPRAAIRAIARDRQTLAIAALGIATMLVAIRMAVFAARLSATDERVRWLLLVTEPVVHPFRQVVDATAARGTIEVASVAAGFVLLIAWAFLLARIDREPGRSA